MKKAIRNGKPVLVPRSIHQIRVYEADGKTILQDFNYEDWMDICTGLKNQIKDLKRSPKYSGYARNWAELAIARSISNLSQDRLIRVAFLSLRALVPSIKTFYLNYLMICGEDYNPETARFKDFNSLLAAADEKLIKSWYQEIETFIVPLLKEVFYQLAYVGLSDMLGCRALPPVLIPFILELKDEIKKLPIYWTDFKGIIVNGEIYHEPYPAHLPPIAREAYWRGGHYVDPKEISRRQVCHQGGSFGPICLAIVEDLLRHFRSINSD